MPECNLEAIECQHLVGNGCAQLVRPEAAAFGVSGIGFEVDEVLAVLTVANPCAGETFFNKYLVYAETRICIDIK